MADAPVIRDLNQTIATIGKSVDPMKKQIDSDIVANQQFGDAQIAGLDAKKTRAFKDIDQNAVDRGMQFGGFGLDSQARYTADTYLPALASLQQTIAQTRSGLMKEKLGLDKDVFDKSWSTVEGDRAALNEWNKMTAQQQFDASEADKQRVWQAAQNEKDRAIQIAGMRSSGGGGGGGGGGDVDLKVVKNAAGGWTVLENGAPSKNYDLASAANALGTSVVSYLANGSPADRAAYNEWKSSGGTNTSILRQKTGAFYLGGAL